MSIAPHIAALKQLCAVLIWLCIAGSGEANAQVSARARLVTLGRDTLSLDSLSIIPSTMKVLRAADSSALNADQYYVDYAQARIVSTAPGKESQRLIISYKPYPYSFTKAFSHKTYKRPMNVGASNNDNIFTLGATPKEDVFGYSSLNRSGSFTRGLSFGNNQDLVVNSYIDIQLSGKIAPDVEILASLNDRSIPIQPDGTTATLQNFDQKFIQISTPRQRLNLGDLTITDDPSNYFLKFNKKVQGISGFSSWNIGSKDSGFSALNLTLTRGIWQRYSFNGTEGNQGPYRLKGAHGELFVVVIAGTERVYFNGALLKRGEQADYVIDYNTGEIRFTPNRLITQYDRLVVEFQYADRNYQRYLLHSYNAWHQNAWDFRLNAYHEADNRNVPLFAKLKASDIAVLSQSGDSSSRAVVPAVDSVDYSENRILYKQIDSAGIRFYRFSTNRDSAHFQLKFALRGPGRGNYRQSKALANGKVYEYVPPVNNRLQGDYDPVVQLVAPQQQQMLTFAARNRLSKSSEAGGELALSGRDRNTLSAIDDGDNTGYAGKFFLRGSKDKSERGSPYRLSYIFDYEHRDKNFTEVERYRSVEFARIWQRSRQNPIGILPPATENIISGGATMAYKSGWTYNALFNGYTRAGTELQGIQGNFGLNYKSKKYELNSLAELTSISYGNNPQKFHSQQIMKFSTDASRSYKYIRFGASGTTEQSAYSLHSDQFLDNSSFKYRTGRIYVSNPEGTANVYGIELNQRTDFNPDTLNRFAKATLGTEFIGKYYFLRQPTRQLKFDVKYRQLNHLRDSGLQLADQDRNTFLTRTEGNLSFLKGGLTTTTFYEISTGREPRRDFLYVQVAKGQGTHTWIDYNNNGLKEFSEFEKAAYPDQAEYVKVVVPSTLYVGTLSNQLQQGVRFQPDKFLVGDKALSRFASRFSDIFSVSAINRIQSELGLNSSKGRDTLLAVLNPFVSGLPSDKILNSTYLLRNALYFNRSNPLYGADITVNQSGQRSFLVSGTDNRRLHELIYNIRYNITPRITLEPSYASGRRSFYADYLASKNYNIFTQTLSGQIVVQPVQKIRFYATYRYFAQEEQLIAETRSYQNEGGGEVRYNMAGKGTIQAKLNYIHIKYLSSGGENYNTPVAYELLQGLRPGRNLTWNASWNQRLQNNLQISFNYDGRQAEGQKAIHLGRANVTWFF